MTGSKDVVFKAPVSLADLKHLTQARIALGRSGSGVPTRSEQSFLLDHARARAAVWSVINREALHRGLAGLGLPIIDIQSRAETRNEYVRRPDLGRILSDASRQRLAEVEQGFDVVILIGDGLSATAVELNAMPLVKLLVERLRAQGLSLGPLLIAEQARVALADPAGELLQARTAVMLIGERPGLSAADSLGAYLTYAPRSGTTDAQRNCVSNIREGGLRLERAADLMATLIIDMLRVRTSGVGLQEALKEKGLITGPSW